MAGIGPLRRRSARAVVVGVLVGPVLSLGAPGCVAAQAGSGAQADAAVGPEAESVRTDRFELRDDPRVGLHHFLVAWAAADADAWPPYALPLAEREAGLDRLSPDERATWEAAVRDYAPTVGASLVFDDDLVALRDWAAGTAPPSEAPERVRGMARALEAALPVYLRLWWPDHRARNRAWIDALAPTLGEVEDEMAPRIAAAYGGAWPSRRIAIDVVAYANDVGAYSTGGRVTVSSLDPEIRMPQALELVFHEASHVDPLEVPLREAVARAFDRAGGQAPDRLWHDLIFVTTGEATRLVLAGHGEPDYRHYGETAGVYARGARWREELRAFERHWLPFVRSGSADPVARDAALGGLARALLDAPR